MVEQRVTVASMDGSTGNRFGTFLGKKEARIRDVLPLKHPKERKSEGSPSRQFLFGLNFWRRNYFFLNF